MTVSTLSPEAAYATKPNIVHPSSNYGTTQGTAQVTAAEAAAKQRISDAYPQVTVTATSIKRGK